MAHEVLRTLLHDIRQVQWFSLIADETRDISGIWQWVSNLSVQQGGLFVQMLLMQLSRIVKFYIPS